MQGAEPEDEIRQPEADERETDRRRRAQTVAAPLSLPMTGARWDPEAELLREGAASGEEGCVHIRVQRRTSRKALTIVQGLPDVRPGFDEDAANKFLKALSKRLCCGGTVVHDDADQVVVQLQGDQREAVRAFLVRKRFCTADAIRVHGY